MAAVRNFGLSTLLSHQRKSCAIKIEELTRLQKTNENSEELEELEKHQEQRSCPEGVMILTKNIEACIEKIQFARGARGVDQAIKSFNSKKYSTATTFQAGS